MGEEKLQEVLQGKSVAWVKFSEMKSWNVMKWESGRDSDGESKEGENMPKTFVWMP